MNEKLKKDECEEIMEAAKKVFLHFQDCVINAAKDDFGVPGPPAEVKEGNLKWFVESVNALRRAGMYSVINNPAFFKEPEPRQETVIFN